VQGFQIPRSGGPLDALLNDNHASGRINPLPFVFCVDWVEMPGGSGAQRTVEYPFCRIVPVPLRRYARSRRDEGPMSGKIVIVDDEPFAG
jgi:hypothetical protein